MRSLFGAGLLGCGGLLAAAFGLVTLVMIAGFVASGADSLKPILLVLAFGGVPCGVGAVMIWFGLRQVREANVRAREKVQSAVFD